MVRCNTCDLVYADQPPPENILAAAYHEANYDSAEEANDAAAAYYLTASDFLDRLAGTTSALEIGAGTGVFLSALHRHGFSRLVGVEPSSSAIQAAPDMCKPWLVEGMFDSSQFPEESFDLICCFMTLEHVLDPTTLALGAHRLLKPGGAFLVVVHDYKGIVNRILGKRSPIVDLEHMQLFSRNSIRELLSRTGYADIHTTSFYNTYSVRYWIRLLPLPAIIKQTLANVLKAFGVIDKKISCNVGNLMSGGFKP
ncbi:MAG TPA: class I SAM-dependent methyltransferase [Pseudomonadales bacterium]|nr:class I SAM-dependent methyltransferase [Pseudomonadales bacterium]